MRLTRADGSVDRRHLLDAPQAEPRQLRLAAARQLGHRRRVAVSARAARRRAAAAAACRQPLPRPLARAGRGGARPDRLRRPARSTTTSSTARRSIGHAGREPRRRRRRRPAPAGGAARARRAGACARSGAGSTSPSTAAPRSPRSRSSSGSDRRSARASAARCGSCSRPIAHRAALAWLAARQLRRPFHDDTGGSEAGMLRGLAWRRAIGAAARARPARRRRPAAGDRGRRPDAGDLAGGRVHVAGLVWVGVSGRRFGTRLLGLVPYRPPNPATAGKSALPRGRARLPPPLPARCCCSRAWHVSPASTPPSAGSPRGCARASGGQSMISRAPARPRLGELRVGEQPDHRGRQLQRARRARRSAPTRRRRAAPGSLRPG